MLRLLCLIGFHRRAGRTVKRMQDGWIGTCARCGVAIQRGIGGSWRRASAGQIAAAERYRSRKA